MERKKLYKQVCVCGSACLWEAVEGNSPSQTVTGRVEGVGGGIAVSSAVMLTDTVPGGAVTQRDALRHSCPINSSHCILRARTHAHKDKKPLQTMF